MKSYYISGYQLINYKCYFYRENILSNFFGNKEDALLHLEKHLHTQNVREQEIKRIIHSQIADFCLFRFSMDSRETHQNKLA